MKLTWVMLAVTWTILLYMAIAVLTEDKSGTTTTPSTAQFIAQYDARLLAVETDGRATGAKLDNLNTIVVAGWREETRAVDVLSAAREFRWTVLAMQLGLSGEAAEQRITEIMAFSETLSTVWQLVLEGEVPIRFFEGTLRAEVLTALINMLVPELDG